MKKYGSLWLSIVLVLALVMMTFAGCGNDEEMSGADDDLNEGQESDADLPDGSNDATDGDENKDEDEVENDEEKNEQTVDSIIGTWESDVDLSDLFNDAMADQGIEVTVDDYRVFMRMTLNNDGTYLISFDEDEAGFEKVRESLKDGMLNYLEGLAGEQDMSLDELLSMLGDDASIDSLIDEPINECHNQIKEMLASSNVEGKYEAEDGKLYVSNANDPDAEINRDNYGVYELNGSQMKLTTDGETINFRKIG